MTTIAVTGSAGAVGRRTIRQLVAEPSVTRIIAVDRDDPSVDTAHGAEPDRVVPRRLDLRAEALAPHLLGVDSVIHLAEDSGRRGDAPSALRLLNRVMEAMEQAGNPHLVVLSSATAYGAHPDNPIPLTESEPLRPNAELEFAVTKRLLEERAGEWATVHDRRLTVLRPATTLSEDGVSWVAASIRAATSVRPDQADPPVQFLHHADLASALALVAAGGHVGAFNVAPDGWIGPEAFHQLLGGLQARVPVAVNDRLLAAGRRLGIRPTPPGIEPYVRHHWVVSNDRLRELGWQPRFSNEETYVISTPSPPWAMSAQRRQEVALGVAGLGVAVVAGAAAAVARRLTRP